MNFVTLNHPPKKKIYFEDMAKDWLLYKKCTVKKSTYYTYQYLVTKYLLHQFENYSIEDFMNFNVNKVIEKMLERLSPKMIKDILNVLKSILKFSEDKYRCKFYIEPIAMPRVQNPELKVLSPKEQKQLEKYCIQQEDNRFIGIILCLYTGMRIGELCALKWEDIDLKARQIRINKTLQRVYIDKSKTTVIIDTPKSIKSSRKIPLNDKMVNLLSTKKPNYPKSSYFLTGSRKVC